MIWFVAFIATVPAANWLVDTVGIVPVGFGMQAPAGVLLAGLALVLRDLVQRSLGAWAALAAIVVGAAVSFALAPPGLVMASTAAFLFSELADFAVYQPLLRRGFLLAVFVSSLVGLVADSALFLWLIASLEYLPGQVFAKAWTVAIAVGVLAARRVS